MTALVWPFRPQTGVVESLEWLTTINRCRAAEYRQCMRTIPRMGIQHDYVLDPAEYGKAVDLCRQSAGAEVLVPEWTSLTHVADIGTSTVTLTIDASAMPAYKVGGKIIVWDNNQDYEVCDVQAIGSGTITISATTRSHVKPTVAPLRSCIFTGEISSDREAVGDRVRAQASFQATVTEDLTPTFGDGITRSMYKGFPVVTDQVQIINGAREDVARELNTLDSRTGLVARTPLFTSATRSGVLAWHKQTAADLWSLRLWLHAQKGQQKGFWVPSWNRDVVLTRDINGNDETVEIAACNFASTYAFPVDFAVLGPGGSFVFPIRITDATAGDSGKELLTLSEPFDGYVDHTMADRTSRLTLSRFASDRVEIQHHPGDAATIVVPIVEDPNTP